MRIIALLACFLLAMPAIAAELDTAMSQGREARLRNDFSAAESAYEQATKLAPTNAEAWHMLGLVRGFQSKYDSALAALDTAEKLAPTDADIALSVARITSFAGRFAEAEQRVNALLVKQPNMQAAWVLKGRIATYTQNYHAARSAYDKAASLAAADVDLLVAYGDLARAQNKEAEARSYYTKASALDPNSADVKQRLANNPTPLAAPWTLTFSGGKSSLSRTPAPDWTAFDISIDRDLANGVHVLGGVSYAKRFALTDVMLRAGGNIAAGRLAANIEIGVTPSADVLAKFQSTGSASYRISDGTTGIGPTIAVLDGQYRHYATGNVKSLSPGIDQYFANGQFVLSGRIANTWDTTNRHLTGWSAGALWQATDRFALRVGYGNAPEAERGAVADTKTLSGGIVVGLTDTLTWRFDIARENRQGGYRRVEAASGFALKF